MEMITAKKKGSTWLPFFTLRDAELLARGIDLDQRFIRDRWQWLALTRYTYRCGLLGGRFLRCTQLFRIGCRQGQTSRTEDCADINYWCWCSWHGCRRWCWRDCDRCRWLLGKQRGLHNHRCDNFCDWRRCCHDGRSDHFSDHWSGYFSNYRSSYFSNYRSSYFSNHWSGNFSNYWCSYFRNHYPCSHFNDDWRCSFDDDWCWSHYFGRHRCRRSYFSD